MATIKNKKEPICIQSYETEVQFDYDDESVCIRPNNIDGNHPNVIIWISLQQLEKMAEKLRRPRDEQWIDTDRI